MAKGAATVKANCPSQRGAGSQLPVSPAHSSLGLQSRASPRYQHPMFVTWVHRTAEGYDVPLACQPDNTRYLKALHYAIRQQERPDVPDNEFPLEPTGRGRSCTPRDASAEMLPSPVEFKDLDKMGAATIDLAHPPIDPVDKVG